MYYYPEKNYNGGYYYPNENDIKGKGIFDSIISAVTSQAAKEVATNVGKKVAEKTLTEIGNRGAQKLTDKIIPPKRKAKGLTKKNKDILDSYAIPIEEYVKT